jgi:hypothetical protein
MNQTINSLGDLQKAIRWFPVEESSEQRHLMALFEPSIWSKAVVVIELGRAKKKETER